MTTQRILNFLTHQCPDGPCLVVDLQIVRDTFYALEKALPGTGIYYAVKANPAPEILKLLTDLGACFDVASISEINMVRNAGVAPDRISFGNTIKKERDIERAYRLGVRQFALDSIEEAEKIARAAPGSRVLCRLLTDGAGAEWPLSRKFGCVPDMAVDVLRYAKAVGLQPFGVSFHVGSQQMKPMAWDGALKDAHGVFKKLSDDGIFLKMINLGGGFPARYQRPVPSAQAYGHEIFMALRRHFGNAVPETIVEPGRGLVGNAGVIKSEVVLISKKSSSDEVRWVYLDIGKFGGLAETMDEAIRYPIATPHDGDCALPCVLAGPTCDSADVLYEQTPYSLPVSLAIGDEVLIAGTGAYTAPYASVAFNGFDPLKTYVI